MLTKLQRCALLVIFFGVACASPSVTLLPAPSSMWVEPDIALQDIDAEKYPEFPDHYAISRYGLQLHMWQDIEESKDALLKLNAKQGEVNGVKLQLSAAQDEAQRAAWWRQWAPFIIVTAGGGGLAVGVAGGVELARVFAR